MVISRFYYLIKPAVPRKMQIFFRRQFAKLKRRIYQDVWPIDRKAGIHRKNFIGWPNNYDFALVLSHDVDTQKGHDQCVQLMDLEESLGFRSCFNFVPERYNLDLDLIKIIKKRGFEVGIHGLRHDGKLFSSKKIFNERAKKINEYIKNWDINGFTAPSMICKLDWVYKLDIRHSTCTFDTDPFEPVPNGIGTIFPFIVENKNNINEKFVELPYTLPQDHTLYVIMQEKSNDIWKQKLEWLARCRGMALLNTHPDYMNFSGKHNTSEQYSYTIYRDFLLHIKKKYESRYWHVLPIEIADYLLYTQNKK